MHWYKKLYASACEGIEEGPKNYASDCLKYSVLCFVCKIYE